MDRMHYMPEDFCRDETYLNYYFRKDAGDILFWEDWISRHPEKLDVIVAADQLIALLSLQLPEDAFLREQERTLGAIRDAAAAADMEQAGEDGMDPDARVGPGRRDGTGAGTGIRLAQKFSSARSMRIKRGFQLLAAAIVIAAVVVGGTMLHEQRSKKETASNEPANASQLIANTGNADSAVVLEDGSRVRLEKGAALTVPAHFAAGKREVWLEGNAFFDVSRNASRPFYIFSKNIVTHVIGTSFFIKQDAVNRKVEVSVVTGKVEVYEKQATETADNKKTRVSNGVILIPNQKVVYGEDQRHFETSLTEVPVPVQREEIEGPADKQLILVEHPIASPVSLSDVLPAIETQYGISIAVENENIYHCHFSGDLSDLGLYEKMDIVCKSVGATYQIRGTQILIRGNGCPATK